MRNEKNVNEPLQLAIIMSRINLTGYDTATAQFSRRNKFSVLVFQINTNRFQHLTIKQYLLHLGLILQQPLTG